MPELGGPEREAGRAGELLFEFSLLLLERQDGPAVRVREELARLLPRAVHAAIFGGP